MAQKRKTKTSAKAAQVDPDLLELYKIRVRDRLTYRRGRGVRRKEDRPKPVGTAIHDYFKRDPDASQKLAQTRAVLAWPEIVGTPASHYSNAKRVRNSQLIVEVTDPMWMQQLLLLRHQIMGKYREAIRRLPFHSIYFVRKGHSRGES